MKYLAATVIAWASLAVVCNGQVRALTRGSAGARAAMADVAARQADLAEHNRAVEMGRELFGSDKRWSASNENEFSGPLSRKTADEFKVGDWGCTAVGFKVLNKVSDTECLVLPSYQDAEVILLRGLDASKVTDGIVFVLQHPVVIEGTFSYTSVAGAQKTVLVLERNESKVTKLADDVHFRKWTDKSGERTFEGKFIEFSNNRVQLIRRDDRKPVQVAMHALSKDDQKWVRDELKKRLEIETIKKKTAARKKK